MRITRQDLESQARYLNKLTGRPEERFILKGARYGDENEGTFYISGAYGGWCLARVHCSEHLVGMYPLGQNHVPKREAYNRISSFIRGIEFQMATAAASQEVTS